MSKKFSTRGHPQLFEINAAAWLFDLTPKLGRPMLLRDVPASEWDALKSQGMDFVWLMGVWSRSEAGRKINLNDPISYQQYQQVLPGCKPEDIVGSCYAVGSGDPDPLVGTWYDIDFAHNELNKRGMGLILDFIPNHRGIDHPWLTDHPEYFIQVSYEEYLKDQDGYFPVKHADETLYIAHGKDPNYPSWIDTAQLNYFNPDTQIAMIRRLEELSRHCDGVRCDMSMLVLKDVFQKTWGWANKNPHYVPPVHEFWSEAFSHVPNLIYIAEAYWDTEWTLQQLGFDYAYDKRLYDRLHNSSPHEVYLHLTAGLDYQEKLLRFIENHDEPRSAAAFGAGKVLATAALFSALPGMKLYFQGQFEGRRLRLPIQILHTMPEAIDLEIKNFYDKLLPLVDQKICHEGTWKIKPVMPDGDYGSQNLLAYLWSLEGQLRFVIVNLGRGPASGMVSFQDDVLELHNYTFVEQLEGERSVQNGKIMAHPGIKFKLTGYEARIYDLFPQLLD